MCTCYTMCTFPPFVLLVWILILCSSMPLPEKYFSVMLLIRRKVNLDIERLGTTQCFRTTLNNANIYFSSAVESLLNKGIRDTVRTGLVFWQFLSIISSSSNRNGLFIWNKNLCEKGELTFSKLHKFLIITVNRN